MQSLLPPPKSSSAWSSIRRPPGPLPRSEKLSKSSEHKKATHSLSFLQKPCEKLLVPNSLSAPQLPSETTNYRISPQTALGKIAVLSPHSPQLSAPPLRARALNSARLRSRPIPLLGDGSTRGTVQCQESRCTFPGRRRSQASQVEAQPSTRSLRLTLLKRPVRPQLRSCGSSSEKTGRLGAGPRRRPQSRIGDCRGRISSAWKLWP